MQAAGKVSHITCGLQINERYVPQLQQVLTWPQSIGIVGVRPSSSLYFIGCQGDQVIYLDPHQAQQVQNACGYLHALESLSARVQPLLALPNVLSAVSKSAVSQ